MAKKAIVLIEIRVGHAREVVEALKNLGGVESADVVTGPYDIIVFVAGKDMGTIADLVATRMHAVQGVARTFTCLSM